MYWLKLSFFPCSVHNLSHKILDFIKVSTFVNLNKNIKPIKKPIRGGTDGSLLTENGVPTPNIFTGMQNVHGPLEWISSTDMSLATEVMIEIIKLNSNLEAKE